MTLCWSKSSSKNKFSAFKKCSLSRLWAARWASTTSPASPWWGRLRASLTSTRSSPALEVVPAVAGHLAGPPCQAWEQQVVKQEPTTAVLSPALAAAQLQQQEQRNVTTITTAAATTTTNPSVLVSFDPFCFKLNLNLFLCCRVPWQKAKSNFDEVFFTQSPTETWSNPTLARSLRDSISMQSNELCYRVDMLYPLYHWHCTQGFKEFGECLFVEFSFGEFSPWPFQLAHLYRENEFIFFGGARFQSPKPPHFWSHLWQLQYGFGSIIREGVSSPPIIISPSDKQYPLEPIVMSLASIFFFPSIESWRKWKG